MTECTLWYWSHGFVKFTLYDDEAAAVSAAIWMIEDGDGAPAGVQFPDGTYIEVEEWPAYLAENDRLTRAAVDSANRATSQPRPATRQVRPPFEHERTVTVPADTPSWVGRQVSLAGEAPAGATGSADPAGAPTGEVDLSPVQAAGLTFDEAAANLQANADLIVKATEAGPTHREQP